MAVAVYRPSHMVRRRCGVICVFVNEPGIHVHTPFTVRSLDLGGFHDVHSTSAIPQQLLKQYCHKYSLELYSLYFW